MIFEPSKQHQPVELPATEVAVLLVEETEGALELVARFKDSLEHLVVTSDGPGCAIEHLERLLRELVRDVEAAASEIAAVGRSSRSVR